MGTIDIWTIYGSREDTDAVVVRQLERERQEAEQALARASDFQDRFKETLGRLGLSFHRGMAGQASVVRIGGIYEHDAPELTAEMVEAIRATFTDSPDEGSEG